MDTIDRVIYAIAIIAFLILAYPIVSGAAVI